MKRPDLIRIGDTVRIEVRGMIIKGVVEAAIDWGTGNGGWDIEYRILNPVPGRGGIGRCKEEPDAATIVVEKVAK